MQTLELKIQPGIWRTFAARKSDPAFAKFSQKIFQRDLYICQFCGFQAKEYQEVINLDQNYYNNRLANLVTACCFCTQCCFLDAVGVSYGGGTLIFMDELTQADINSFSHVLFCAMTNDTGYGVTAQNIYRNFKMRSHIVESQFGEGVSEPAVFSQLIFDSFSGELEKAKPIFQHLRLLPSRVRFKQQIEHWASTALTELAKEF